MSTTVQVLENTPEKKSRTESLPGVFPHDNCEQIYFILLFCLSHKKRNKKRDSSYTAKHVSSLLASGHHSNDERVAMLPCWVANGLTRVDGRRCDKSKSRYSTSNQMEEQK
jgi:hypothetical protein